MKPQASAFLDKSRELLGQADTMQGVGLYEAAGRTAYLAGLHAAQALIFERTGKIIRRHRGVHGELGRLTKDEPLCRCRRRASRVTISCFAKDRQMADGELYRKGMDMRRQLLGEDYLERLGREVYDDPLMQKFVELATETVFGALWTRPGLDLKTRALICVVSDAASGRAPELALHLRMAVRQGWSEEELGEALLHLVGYVGAPLVRESLLVARKVFAELRAGTG